MHNALRAVLSALILVLAACTPRIEPRAPTAAAPSELEVAQRIFDQITALHVSGLPNDSQMQVLAPLLTVELCQALDAARAWQRSEVERMQREGSDDKPPFIEGDLFSSLFEGAQTARAVAARLDQDRVVVTLDRSYGQGADQVRWQDNAVLKRVGEVWLLDDVEYGGGWAFQAGTTTLRNTLQARE